MPRNEVHELLWDYNDKNRGRGEPKLFVLDALRSTLNALPSDEVKQQKLGEKDEVGPPHAPPRGHARDDFR